MSLTKREIAARVAERVGITQSAAAAQVQATLDVIAEELAAGGHIELRGFGVFEIKMRQARVGRNPNRPENDVAIPARNVIKFRAGKELADTIAKL